MRRLLLLVPLALALLPAATSASAAKTKTTTIHVTKIDYPSVTRIKAGGRVTWSFEMEYTPHNVTSTGKSKFKSSPDPQLYGTTYSVRFAKRGTYTYECTIHPNMDGKIVVK